MVGKAHVVVGAEVQHRAAVFQRDLGGLRAGDDALGLEQAGVADFVEGVGVALGQGHGGSMRMLFAILWERLQPRAVGPGDEKLAAEAAPTKTGSEAGLNSS